MLGSEFWAAIWGSVVGGAISALIQWRATVYDRERKDKDAADLERSTGLAMVYKARMMTANVAAYHKHFSKEPPPLPGDQDCISLVTSHPATVPPAIRFSDAEMTLAMKRIANEFWEKMLNLQERHAAMLSRVEAFGKIKERMAREFPPGFKPSALVQIKDEIVARQLAIGDALVKIIIEELPNDVKLAKEVLTELHRYFYR